MIVVWLNVNGYDVGCENIVYKKGILPYNDTQEWWESKKFKTF